MIRCPKSQAFPAGEFCVCGSPGHCIRLQEWFAGFALIFSVFAKLRTSDETSNIQAETPKLLNPERPITESSHHRPAKKPKPPKCLPRTPKPQNFQRACWPCWPCWPWEDAAGAFSSASTYPPLWLQIWGLGFRTFRKSPERLNGFRSCVGVGMAQQGKPLHARQNRCITAVRGNGSGSGS